MNGSEQPPAAEIAAALVRGRRWIAAAAALSALLTTWLVVSSPTRWMASARLELEDPGLTPAAMVAQVRSGAVLERLRAVGGLATRAPGVAPDPAATARVLAEQIRVAPGEGREVWVTAWHVDGGRARDLVLAVVEATAAVDRDRRSRELADGLARLESERLELISRLGGMAAGGGAADPPLPTWGGLVGEEVERARIRRVAERLAAVEQELEDVRAAAADPPVSWTVADPPAAWQHPLPRRLGAPVAAALTLPALVAALAWLVHDRRRG